MITYPPATGRNFQEILRVLDGLQLTDSHSVATPADWKDGQDVVIVPSLTDPEAEGTGIYFGKDPKVMFVNVQHSTVDDGDATWAIVRTK